MRVGGTRDGAETLNGWMKPKTGQGPWDIWQLVVKFGQGLILSSLASECQVQFTADVYGTEASWDICAL